MSQIVDNYIKEKEEQYKAIRDKNLIALGLYTKDYMKDDVEVVNTTEANGDEGMKIAFGVNDKGTYIDYQYPYTEEIIENGMPKLMFYNKVAEKVTDAEYDKIIRLHKLTNVESEDSNFSAYLNVLGALFLLLGAIASVVIGINSGSFGNTLIALFSTLITSSIVFGIGKIIDYNRIIIDKFHQKDIIYKDLP